MVCIKTQFMKMPKCFQVIKLPADEQFTGRIISCPNLPSHHEIEGEVNFPIQVRSGACYFYCGNCYFYFSYLPHKCRSRANIQEFYINHKVKINLGIFVFPIMMGLLPNYTALCNVRPAG